MDGLHDLRAMLVPAQSAQATGTGSSSGRQDPVPSHWRCNTLETLQWYCEWKALSTAQMLAEGDNVPLVSSSDLLSQLGVPELKAQLAPSSLASLRRVVLSAFRKEVVALIADQLPELDLLSKLEWEELFTA